MKLLLKALAVILSFMLVGVLAYLGAAFGLAFFPANKSAKHETPAIQAYIASNGVHTDFVFPIQSQWMDWRDLFPFADFSSPEFLSAAGVDVVMIGWGDEQFYLNTPQWQDLSVTTALRALSGTNPSLVHVTYYRERALPKSTYTLPLDARQYQTLITYIKTTLQWREGKTIPLQDAGYSSYDAFYRARGSYSAIFTCNSWIGDGLQQTGVTVSLWTPFATNVFKHLQQRVQ